MTPRTHSVFFNLAPYEHNHKKVQRRAGASEDHNNIQDEEDNNIQDEEGRRRKEGGREKYAEKKLRLIERQSCSVSIDEVGIKAIQILN